MTEIAYTGDVAFTKYFSKSCFDEKLLSDEVVSFLSSTDYTVVNVEGAIAVNTARTDKPLTHANPPACVEWFKKINGNIWSLANNHAMDCGVEGLQSTLKAAEENQCRTVGAGMNLADAIKPVVIDAEGGIGIVAVTYSRQNRADAQTPGCFAAEDEALVKAQIEKIKAENRWCIVVSHVGQEFSQMPMPYLRRRYKRYLQYGADIVVGHHPHVVQNYETFGEKVVFYSLGNFIFDTDFQRVQKYTDRGILLKLRFDEDAYSWEYLPVQIQRDRAAVTAGQTPEIFRNIRASEYGLLWPLAAKRLCMNERKKIIFHHPDYAERTWLEWLLKYDLKKCKKPYMRDVLMGRVLQKLHLWKFADKKTVQYLTETEPCGE